MGLSLRGKIGADLMRGVQPQTIMFLYACNVAFFFICEQEAFASKVHDVRPSELKSTTMFTQYTIAVTVLPLRLLR